MNLTMMPEAHLSYAKLGIPDEAFGDFKVTCTFRHDLYTDEQKQDLHNMLSYFTKMHPDYDKTKSVYSQVESLKIAVKGADGFYFMKPRQYHKTGKDNLFKVVVKDPYNQTYGLPNIGAMDPWDGVEHPLPMLGDGTMGKVVVEPNIYNSWTDEDGQTVPGGVNFRLKEVYLTTVVEYQSKPQENKVSSKPPADEDDNPFLSEKKEIPYGQDVNETVKDVSDMKKFEDFDDEIPF